MADDPTSPDLQGEEPPTVTKGEAARHPHERDPKKRVTPSPSGEPPERLVPDSGERSAEGAPTQARLTVADQEPDNSPRQGLRGRLSASRTTALAVSALALVAVLFGVAYAAKAWPFVRSDEQTVEFVADDGTRITARAKVIGGDLRIVPLDEATVKPSWIPVTTPVRIEAPGLDGVVTVTFTPSQTFKDRVPQGSDVVIVAVDDAEGALPIGTTVTEEGAYEGQTTRSDVAVVLPNTEQILGALKSPLWSPAKASDPLAAALFKGTSIEACSASSGPVLSGSAEEPYCNDYLESTNRYRLTLTNFDAVPYVATLPTGIPTPKPAKSDDSLMAYLTGDRGAGKLLVAASKGATVLTYSGENMPASSLVPAQPDIEAWTLYAMRETLLTTVDRSATRVRPASVKRIDQVLAQSQVTACTSKAAVLAKNATPAAVDQAAKKAFPTCLPVAVKALAASYAKDVGGRADETEQDVTKLLGIGGRHSARVDSAWLALARPSLDEPAHRLWTAEAQRYMTNSEVATLPVAAPKRYGSAHICSPPPRGDALPAGVPDYVTCLWVTTADLQGKGNVDRLVTWAAGQGSRTNTYSSRGATAYFADGRVSILPQSEVPSSADGVFTPGPAVYLSNDTRQQVLVLDVYGAHSEVYSILTTGSDGKLHVVRNGPNAAEVFMDGAAQMAAGYGCYARDGVGRLALWSWSGRYTGSDSASVGTLTVEPMQIEGLEMRRAAPNLTYATVGYPDVTKFPVGSECTVADPARRSALRINGLNAVSTTTPAD